MADSRKVTVQFLGDDKSLGSTANSVDGKLGKLGAKFAAFGAAAAAGLAVATVAAAKGLYEIGQQFDSATDKIRISTGATGKRLEQFETSLKNVAKGTPSSLEDVGSAIADVAQRLDLTGKPLEDVSKRMLNLSRITETDLGSNVESLSRLFGDWSIKTEDMTGSMDKLFRASQATGLPVDQLAQSMVQFGGPMRQLGFDFDTTAALLGKFQKEGVNSNLVMGAMRIALGKMAKEGEPAQETLERVTEQIANAGDASKANKIALELFGAKAGPDMAAAIREGRFAVGDLVKQIAGGRDTIQKASDDTADFGEKWQILKNKVFITLEPLATKTFNAVGRGMDLLGPKVQQLAKWYRQDLSPALAELGDWINQKVVPAAQQFYRWFASKIAPALKNFADKDLAAARDGLRDVERAFKRNAPEVRKFGQWIKKAGEWTAKYLVPVLSKVSGHQLKSLGKSLGIVIDAFGLWVRWAAKVGGALRRVGGFVMDLARTVLNGAKSFDKFTRSVIDKIGAALNYVRSVPGKIKGALGGLGNILYAAGRQVIGGLIDGIVDKAEDLWNELKSITSKIPLHKGPPAKDRKLLTPAGVAIMEGLIGGIESQRPKLESVLEKITAYVEKTGDKLSSLLSKRTDLVNSFKGMSESVFSADLSNPETGIGPTAGGLVAFQQQQLAKARQIKADIAAASKMGLSPALIKQFLSQGESGVANLHALASGSKAEVQQLNHLNNATTKALGSAGMNTAGYLGINSDIRDARKQHDLAAAIAREFRKELARAKDNTEVHIHLEGKDIVYSLVKHQKKTGRKLPVKTES